TQPHYLFPFNAPATTETYTLSLHDALPICISDSVKRAGDCAARFGGEEFAVLLPGCSATDALAVAENIRRKVELWSEDPKVTTVDRKSTRLNSSHLVISYAVFCLKKKTKVK